MPFGIKFNPEQKKKPVVAQPVNSVVEKPVVGKLPAGQKAVGAPAWVPAVEPLHEDAVTEEKLDAKKNSAAIVDKEIEPGSDKLVEPFEVSVDSKSDAKTSHEFLPVGVSSFDDLIERKGIERGSTILISGGCGTGKTTFCVQSLYNGILRGEKSVYLTFEESPEKIRRHMFQNFGWDLEKLEKEGKLAILKLNPFKIARSVEASLVQQRRALLIKVEQISLPFMPDRIIVDSLSALSIAFMGNTENYRYYVRHMFEILDHYNSINFVISETEQDPGIYSRTGMEEFLADGVVVFYNLKVGRTRERALEILKLRCSNHVKELVPYQLAKGGFVIFRGSEVEDQLRLLTDNDLSPGKKNKAKRN